MFPSRKVLNTLLFSSVLLFSACSNDKPQQTTKEIPPLQVNTITVTKEGCACLETVYRYDKSE